MKNIIEHLEERNFFEQLSSPNLKKACHQPISVYVGFDPTSDSLHLGNLVGIIALSWFQKFGHNIYVILGGATGRIGDPSGKSLERPLLDMETLDRNLRSIDKFFHKVLDFSTASKAKILNNLDWYQPIHVIEFFRDIGKLFRLGPMLSKESVKQRLNSEEGMSFTEFSYQILQAYDFYYLNQQHNIQLQLGGSDQWGNITSGTEFIRKTSKAEVFGATFPLLTRSDGKKFGKSEKGAIWLDSEKLSPYDFYQYLFRIPDSDVIYLLKMLTFLSLEEINAIELEMKKSDYRPNSAQTILAREVTKFVHGDKGVQQAELTTQVANPGKMTKLNRENFQIMKKSLPCHALQKNEIVGKKYVDIVSQMGFLQSKSEAIRLIKNGGAYLNNQKIEDPQLCIHPENLIDNTFLLFGFGKKKKILIEING